MKWTQLAVIVSLAIQHTCAIQTHLGSSIPIFDGDTVETIRDPIGKIDTISNSHVNAGPEYDHRIYSSLYNVGGNHGGDKKIIKVIKFVKSPSDIEQRFNDQALMMEKRQVPEGMPKPTKPAGASGSISGAAAKSKVRFGGKGGKIAAGIGLAAIATGATVGAVAHHHLKKNEMKNEFSQFSPQMMKRQDTLNQPFEKRRGKGKAALLIAGGAAAGALAMHHFGKPAAGAATATDPNAPPPPAK